MEESDRVVLAWRAEGRRGLHPDAYPMSARGLPVELCI